MPIPRFAAAEGIKDSAYDAVVLVTAASSPDTLPDPFRAHVEEAKSIDSSVFSSPSVIKCSDVAGGRFVLAATGPLNRGIDDVRRISDAAFNGVNRALKAGASAPLIVFTKDVRGSGKTTERYVKAVEVGLLGVADALHVPLQVREAKPESEKVEKVGYVANYPDGEPMKEVSAGLAFRQSSFDVLRRLQTLSTMWRQEDAWLVTSAAEIPREWPLLKLRTTLGRHLRTFPSRST